MLPDHNGACAAVFNKCQALVYVGAVGIAVRTIAPFIKSKLTDPAVISVDERGSFVIPLLAGHIGGANELSRCLAAALGATACVTTATDVNGLLLLTNGRPATAWCCALWPQPRILPQHWWVMKE